MYMLAIKQCVVTKKILLCMFVQVLIASDQQQDKKVKKY